MNRWDAWKEQAEKEFMESHGGKLDSFFVQDDGSVIINDYTRIVPIWFSPKTVTPWDGYTPKRTLLGKLRDLRKDIEENIA